MAIKNRNDRIWLAVNTATGEVDYAYVHEPCNSDCEWGEHVRANDHRLIHGWEFRPFIIVPDTE